MRILPGLSIVALSASMAGAQPGQPYPPPQPQPAPYPAPYPQPYPQPAPYYPGVPAPYQYQPQVQLTAEEQELLMKGEISDGEHLGGGLAALFLGFGVGQGIQGRWSDTGWLFTFGELASVGLLVYGATRTFDCYDGVDHLGHDCRTDAGTGSLIVGALAFTGLRIWETVDAFAVPPDYNRKVRMVRMKAGLPPRGMYYVVPPARGDGGMAGVSVRF